MLLSDPHSHLGSGLMADIKVKRVYEASDPSDGLRVLVDRVWPRGMTKEKAAIDLWAKDVAPTTVLRKWFSHDPAKWDEFQKRYTDELRSNPNAMNEFLKDTDGKAMTLLYGAKDEQHNQAIVLEDYIKSL